MAFKGTSIAIPSADNTKPIGVTLVHGLLSGDDCWATHLMAWGNANTELDFSSLTYWEGVFGWGHCDHVKKLAQLLRDEQRKCPEGKQHAIGHSNGARMLLEAMASNPDLFLDDLHLVAAWAYRDCDVNAINQLLDSGRVKRVFVYVSKADEWLGKGLLNRSRTLGKHGPDNAEYNLYPFSECGELKPSLPLNVFVEDTHQHSTWVNGEGGFNAGVLLKILKQSVEA